MATKYVGTAAARGTNWATTLTGAAYKTWALRVKAALDGGGLVQTSDTGQIDVNAIVSAPAANTDAGYLVYRFNDAAQGSDPIFLKIFIGMGVNTAKTRVRVQIGQGSNGSGTLTGTVSGIVVAGADYSGANQNPASTDYAYHGDGVFWLLMEMPGAEAFPPRHFFIVSRTRTASGVKDAEGAVMIVFQPASSTTASPSALHYVDWTYGVDHIVDGFTHQFCLPVGEIQSDDNGDKLAWPHWYMRNGAVRRAWDSWTSASVHLTSGVNTFNAAPYGTTRTWLSVGDDQGKAVAGTGLLTLDWALVFPWDD